MQMGCLALVFKSGRLDLVFRLAHANSLLYSPFGQRVEGMR